MKQNAHTHGHKKTPPLLTGRNVKKRGHKKIPAISDGDFFDG
jgi:hypothetical protein